MLEIPYVAGIIDGEGCIGFNLSQKKFLRVTVDVAMSHFELIEALHSQFGGSLMDRGQIEGRKRIYRWTISGAVETKAFLVQILPYLIVKRKAAELALAFLELGVTSNKDINDIFIERMHQNNKKGA